MTVFYPFIKKLFSGREKEKSSSRMTGMAFVVIGGGEGIPYSRDICKNVCLEQMPHSNTIARNLDL